MFTDQEMKKAYQIALGRLIESYEWTASEYEQLFLPVISCGESEKEALEKALREVDPSKIPFNDHVWHTLLEFGRVMPDRTIVFKFRNGKKQIVSLDEIGS